MLLPSRDTVQGPLTNDTCSKQQTPPASMRGIFCPLRDPEAFKDCSRRGEIVLDPFGGSGRWPCDRAGAAIPNSPGGLAGCRPAHSPTTRRLGVLR
jgi:hypothetical protein